MQDTYVVPCQEIMPKRRNLVYSQGRIVMSISCRRQETQDQSLQVIKRDEIPKLPMLVTNFESLYVELTLSLKSLSIGNPKSRDIWTLL
jgi:hypothetical protein